MKDMYGKETYNQISDGDCRGEDFLWSYIHELKITEKAFELICDDLLHKSFWLPFVPNTVKEIKDYYIKLAKGE